jgi:hypothetical protein
MRSQTFYNEQENPKVRRIASVKTTRQGASVPTWNWLMVPFTFEQLFPTFPLRVIRVQNLWSLNGNGHFSSGIGLKKQGTCSSRIAGLLKI